MTARESPITARESPHVVFVPRTLTCGVMMMMMMMMMMILGGLFIGVKWDDD